MPVDIDVRALSEWDKHRLLTVLLGYAEPRPWTEMQEMNYLLGSLRCPEGHQGPFHHFWLDVRSADFVEADGSIILNHAQANEGLDPPGDFDGVGCGHPGCEGKPDFYVPYEYLRLKIAERDEDPDFFR